MMPLLCSNIPNVRGRMRRSILKIMCPTYEVLVEGVSKRSRDQLFGRTEQNRVVVFDRGTHRIGDFVNVRVTEASSATLKGEEV